MSNDTNKATEEDELPDVLEAIAKQWDGCEYDDVGGAIDIGDALRREFSKLPSRQVANKAEVEPVRVGEVELIDTEAGEAVIRLEDHIPKLGDVLYATPPATTGASTVRDQALEEIAIWYSTDGWLLDEDDIPAEIRALKGSVGASTVLTDEQASAIVEQARLAVDAHCDSLSMEPSKEYSDACLYHAIAREVEAQAGQNCFLSWGGKNVHGDEASIKAVKAALHDAGTVPELKDRIRDLQAQAGQVAVPEGWTLVRGGEDIQLRRADGKWCGYSPEIDSPAHRLTHEFLSAMLAAAPSPAKESK